MADLQGKEKHEDKNSHLSLKVVKRGQSNRRFRNFGV
jgi:hypothetical protein